MLKLIDPTRHLIYQTQIESLLRLFKQTQAFELSQKAYSHATFIVAEDKARGIYGGAIFFPQKVRELNANLSSLLSMLGNRTLWCARLCYCANSRDVFSTRESIELLESFYISLYEILGILGERKDTNCLPLTLLSKDYRDSLAYGQWRYLAEVHPHPPDSDFVHTLLALPEKKIGPKGKHRSCRNMSSSFAKNPIQRSVR